MNDLARGMLTMKMDIYIQSDSQDPDTGAITKQWNYSSTVPCYAKGVISNSATSRSGDKQIMGNKYAYQQYLEVRTANKLTLREKITNISDIAGNVIWEELNYPTNTPTVYEVIGTTPLTDPFGDVLGYNSTIRRSENQIIGL